MNYLLPWRKCLLFHDVSMIIFSEVSKFLFYGKGLRQRLEKIQRLTKLNKPCISVFCVDQKMVIVSVGVVSVKWTEMLDEDLFVSPADRWIFLLKNPSN